MLKKSAVFFFIFFICLIILGSSNYLLTKVAGIDLKAVLGVSILYVSIFFLLFAVLASKYVDKSYKRNSLLVNLLLIYTIFIFIYGFLKGNQIGIIFEELWVISVVYLAYKVSINKNIWISFNSYIFGLFIFTAFILYIGLNETREYLDELEVAASVLEDTTTSLAYELVSLTDFWPFLFALFFFRKDFTSKIIAFIPFIVYLLLQLYFLKRAPAVRAVLQVSTFLLIAALAKNKAKGLVRIIPVVILLLFLFYLVLPQSLIDRFKNDDGSRPDELVNMVLQFNPVEAFIGKGLGGAYVSDNGIYDYIDLNGGSEMRSTVHIGIAYPFLKGGIFFLILVCLHLGNVIVSAYKYKKHFTNVEIASFGFLLVFCLFRLIEGPINAVTVFNGIMFGMSIGNLEQFISLHKKAHVESISSY